MAKEVFIPKLGQTVEEVTLVRWLVADGAKVEQGDGVLEVETDKALFTVESSARGYVHIGPYKEGDVVPVLTVVATIGKPEEKFVSGGQPAAETAATVPTEQVSSAAAATAVAASAPAQGKVFASPRARKLAAAKDVDLAQVTPTGGDGQRVAERDVLAYLEPASQSDACGAKSGCGSGHRFARSDRHGAGRQDHQGRRGTRDQTACRSGRRAGGCTAACLLPRG